MKTFIENIKNMETSKKLLGLLTFLFVSTSTINYTFGYIGIETSAIDTTYTAITDLFKLYVVVYAGKAGAENVTKIAKGSVE